MAEELLHGRASHPLTTEVAWREQAPDGRDRGQHQHQQEYGRLQQGVGRQGAADGDFPRRQMRRLPAVGEAGQPGGVETERNDDQRQKQSGPG